MKKLNIIFIITLLLASCSKPQNKGEIQGKTDREYLALTTKVPGRIEQMLVKEGDFVKKGDTLIILDVPEVDAKKSQALGAVESADAQYSMTLKGATNNQLTQLHAKENALQEQFNFAEKSLNRLKNMLKDSLIPQQKYDEVYAKYQGAKAQLDAVKAEIKDVQNGVRPEQQGMARGQKNRALGALQEVNTAASEKYIIAPTDMKIEAITLKLGELALPGYTLIQAELPGTTYFTFTVPENELNKVKKDDEVEIKAVYQNRTIAGRIANIKKLPSYADIQTAFPDYEMSQSLFEVTVFPKNLQENEPLITGTTVTIKL